MTTNYFYMEDQKYAETEEEIGFLKKHTAEYLRVRPYFSEDFYPLTEYSDKSDAWCGWQLHSEAENAGAVQLFRRENSPFDAASLALFALTPGTTYVFEDADGGEFTAEADELLSGNFKFQINEKRKAKLYFYRAKL